MNQLTYIKKRTLEWREAKDPVLAHPSDALVRPFAVARCDLDVGFLFNNITQPLKWAAKFHYIDPSVLHALGADPFQGPFAFGHECVAEVIEIGDEVRGVKIGDKVIVPFQVACGSCLTCSSGVPSRCEHERTKSTDFSMYGFGKPTGNWGGAASDSLLVPFADAMLVKIPDQVDAIALASASDNVPDAWRTVGPYLQKNSNQSVLINGGGQAKSVGLYAAAISVALKASKVCYIDSDQHRLEIAQSLGAETIQVRKSGWGKKSQLPTLTEKYDIGVDASGHELAIEYLIKNLRVGGICTTVGWYFKKANNIPLWEMYVNSIQLVTGAAKPIIDLPAILQLYEQGNLELHKVNTVVADWQDAPKAFLEREPKVIIRRDLLGSAHLTAKPARLYGQLSLRS